MKKIVVLSGAGMSAESGVKTFRDAGGLWDTYRIDDVATYDAWRRNPAFVLAFYNNLRRQVLAVEPNAGHRALARLEEKYQVKVITQNVDDLHERASSSRVLHLHGELRKSRSTAYPELVYDIEGWALNLGDLCERGCQLRPHIVWFGESVPLMSEAARICRTADMCLVIGTSMQVYPAAGLISFVPDQAPKYYIDPAPGPISGIQNLTVVPKRAGVGVPELVEELMGN